MRRRERALQVFARAGAGVDQAAITQFLPRRQIDAAALALRVRREGPAHARPLIPVESKPAQIFIHGAHEFRPAALIVEVFIAEDERAGGVARALPGDPESAGVAKMEVSRGRGSETAAIWRAFSH